MQGQIRNRSLYTIHFGWITGVTISALLLIGIWGIGNSPYFILSDIQIRGPAELPLIDIEKQIRFTLQNNKCLRVSRCDNILLFPRKYLHFFIEKHYPNVSDIDFSITTQNIITVTLETSPVIGVWCLPQADMKNHCWGLRADGIITTPTPQYATGTGFLYHPENTKLQVRLTGKQKNKVLSPSEIYSIDTLINQSNSMNVSRITYDRRSFYLYIYQLYGKTVSQNTYIRIDRKLINETVTSVEYIQKIITILESLENLEQFRKSFYENPTTLQYIDVRFPDRLYFRFE